MQYLSQKYQMTLRTLLLLIIDVTIVNFSFYTSLALIFNNDISKVYSVSYFRYFPILTILMISVFLFFKLYKSLWRYASIDEMISVIEANFIGIIVVFLVLMAFGVQFPKRVFVVFFLLNIVLVGGSRFAYRVLRLVKYKKFGLDKTVQNVLVIGGGSAGSTVIKEINESPQLNKNIVGIIDDDKSKIGRSMHGRKVLGTRDNITEIVDKYNVNEIIIALPSAPKKEIKSIIEVCKKTKCKLSTLPGVYELIDGKVSVKKLRDVKIDDLLGREPVKTDLNEIGSYLENQVILVTGGGGSIGSELCRQISKFNPKKLLILDMYENNAYDIQNELKMTFGELLNLETIIANIRDEKRLEEIFEKYRPDLVFHAAACKHVPLMEDHPFEAIKTNVFGTLTLVKLSDKYKVKKFVLISTDKAVNPTNVMGATKRAAEKIIQSYNKISNTEFVAVRFGNVLGSNGSVIPLFKKQIINGGPVTVTHPEIIRYFMTISEAVQLVLQAGAMAKGGEIFVLDMGEPVKILDLAKDLIRLSGFEPEEDIKIEFTGLRPGEKLYEELLMAEEGLQRTKNDKIFIGKSQNISNGELLKQLEGLKEIVELNSKEELMKKIKEIVPTYRKPEEVNGNKAKKAV